MAADPTPTASRVSPFWSLAVAAAAALVAVGSARPYAGCWNDGSRLATVESLVDRHTLAIDDSVFVRPPPCDDAGTATPYPRDEPNLLAHGTGDKLLIRGHYYSDKSPVPALFLAGVYAAWQAGTGETARERPDRFAYVMTLASSGVAYVFAVWCVFQFGGPLELALRGRLLLAASFALGTVALPYVRHVNNHVLLLGVAAGLVLGLAWLGVEAAAGRCSWWRLIGLGSLAGLGYTIDLGAGPVLVVCTLAVVVWHCRRIGPAAAFLAAALPWLVLHHAVNYATGGTFKPANAVPEYFDWPGCTFTAQNLTGSWNHPSVGHCLRYAADLLLGRRGFLGHNLPLFLAVAGAGPLLWRRVPEWPAVLFAVAWSGGTWLAYALTSNNLSGQCCSVRWFVPLLAPGYYVLAVLLGHFPRHGPDFLVLAGWGGVVAALAWVQGPWMKHMVPGYWGWYAAGLLSWLAVAVRRRRANRREAGLPAGPAARARAA
jgi:hypothetical protein